MTIQEQLRDYADQVDDAYNQPGHESPWARTLWDAADRIEVLESVVSRADKILGEIPDHKAVTALRAALAAHLVLAEALAVSS